jgi:hypothetical protein
MRMSRIAVVFALLVAASSCSKCDSCKGSSNAPDAGRGPVAVELDAAPPVVKPKTTASTPPMEANYACRMIARAIAEKACECPQKNNAGCCAFGAPTVTSGVAGPVPYLDCSKGRTDWPADLETRLCKVGSDEKKKDLLLSCFAVKEKLRCGKTAGNDLGVEVPRDCETLLKEATGAK